MSDEIAYLTQTNMDLQVNLDRLREQFYNVRDEYVSTRQSLAEALEMIKELNAVIDRLRLHIQQGVEL